MRQLGVRTLPDTVIVGQPTYLAALNDLMAEVPLADWKTYARARTLSEGGGPASGGLRSGPTSSSTAGP